MTAKPKNYKRDTLRSLRRSTIGATASRRGSPHKYYTTGKGCPESVGGWAADAAKTFERSNSVQHLAEAQHSCAIHLVEWQEWSPGLRGGR